MNYNNKKVAVTGYNGFIGSALISAITDAGALIDVVNGDIRKAETFKHLNQSYDYLFHFAAPSSQVQFKRNPVFCIESTIKGIINAGEACRKHGIRLIYPSTGLLSSDRYNEYAMCKKLCEDYIQGLGIDALGIRIFATYGPGEDHKADYASVPFIFGRDMAAGKSPIIFGDGKQERDFIYIDDVVQSILHLAEECYDPIVDVGSGEPYTFNALINMINTVLGTKIEPVFIDKPGGYVQETEADPTRLHDFYKPQIKMIDGISKMLKGIQ